MALNCNYQNHIIFQISFLQIHHHHWPFRHRLSNGILRRVGCLVLLQFQMWLWSPFYSKVHKVLYILVIYHDWIIQVAFFQKMVWQSPDLQTLVLHMFSQNYILIRHFRFVHLLTNPDTEFRKWADKLRVGFLKKTMILYQSLRTKQAPQLPSQAAPTILVLKTWVSLWHGKKGPDPKKYQADLIF